MPAFIETQFPIARLSAESYKESNSGASQTLTGLGKWWYRKPLILVRASILGMLMPASKDAKKDREIFLKILTMDDAGAWDRCKPAVQRKTTHAAFDALPYAERIRNCERPENVAGPSEATWAEINNHLGTQAKSLPELVEQLGQQQFGHTPRVGDSFCGGGSIPFEAARMGCEAFGSDLNPVAGLLTWASLNLLGGGKAVQDEVMRVQAEALTAADKQITVWGIEHNGRDERADAFLYCMEVKPEGCDYYIPLAPSWVISEKYRIMVSWQKVAGSDRLQPTVVAVSESELKLYKDTNGWWDNRVIVDPFDASRSWSIEALRGLEGLCRWSNDDVVPRPGGVFQERLFCIRWINTKGELRYAAPDADDLARETKVMELLRERFAHWQGEGFIPSKAIPEGGGKTKRFRKRGWTHWHHLFTPRQLLAHGLLAEISAKLATSKAVKVGCLLGLGRMANRDSRLCIWQELGNIDGLSITSSIYFFVNRGLIRLSSAWDLSFELKHGLDGSGKILNVDARDLRESCDIWITDPPYADAVNYHELGDFFLAWYDKQIAEAFPDWIPDARAELAVRGDGEGFRRAMVEIYQNLAKHMPENGMQMVMFTHRDPAVWADLGMILCAAGLKVTAVWKIFTNIPSRFMGKEDHVSGIVCLVLRKRTANEPGFLNEINPLVEDEVKNQIGSMQALSEVGEFNFINDFNYNLAAYTAALKVLTQYGSLDGKVVEHELFGEGAKNQKSAFQVVIERALALNGKGPHFSAKKDTRSPL